MPNYCDSSKGLSTSQNDSDGNDLDSPSTFDRFIKHKSWVWNYGKCTFYIENGKKKAHWHCDECTKNKMHKVLQASSTTWIRNHLVEEHQIHRPKYQASIVPIMMNASGQENSIINSIKPRAVDIAQFRRLITKWMCVSRQAFIAIEHPLFREMIAALSLDAAQMIPSSGTTIRNWIIREFERQKMVLIERLSH